MAPVSDAAETVVIRESPDIIKTVKKQSTEGDHPTEVRARLA